MDWFPPATRHRAAGLIVAAALALTWVPSAHASTACSAQGLTYPFTPWVDPAAYELVPGGTLESGAGWSLAGGAALTTGNEVFHVHAVGDARSLALPPGSSATTAPMCVGLEDPTLRLFARNTGSALSSLRVEVLFTDATGHRWDLPIGAYLGTSSWQPTLPLAVLGNLALPGDHVDVAFRFTSQGAGNWSIDDLYVDPWRHG